MATVVISGRVAEETKRRCDGYLRAAGTTPAEVIKVVWENIAQTGEIPQPLETEHTDSAWDFFMAFRATLPPSPELTELSDRDMRDLVASRYA